MTKDRGYGEKVSSLFAVNIHCTRTTSTLQHPHTHTHTHSQIKTHARAYKDSRGCARTHSSKSTGALPWPYQEVEQRERRFWDLDSYCRVRNINQTGLKVRQVLDEGMQWLLRTMVTVVLLVLIITKSVS